MIRLLAPHLAPANCVTHPEGNRDPGLRRPEPSACSVTSMPPQNAVLASGRPMTIGAAAAAFLNANPAFDQDQESSRWTSKTRSQFDAAIFLAEKFFGPEVTISAIDETMLANLFRTMRALPSNHHKSPAHAAMSLEQIAASNQGKGLSSATTNRHMRFLKVVFDWASKRILDPHTPHLYRGAAGGNRQDHGG